MTALAVIAVIYGLLITAGLLGWAERQIHNQPRDTNE